MQTPPAFLDSAAGDAAPLAIPRRGRDYLNRLRCATASADPETMRSLMAFVEETIRELHGPDKADAALRVIAEQLARSIATVNVYQASHDEQLKEGNAARIALTLKELNEAHRRMVRLCEAYFAGCSVARSRTLWAFTRADGTVLQAQTR
jgi:hypothetical protein